MTSQQEEKKIEIGNDSLRDLNVIRKWTMFLAIMGFIGVAVVFFTGVLTFLFLKVFKTSDSITGLPESLFVIIVAVLALLYFFPVRYLYLFSKHTGNALKSMDKEDLKKAFRNLKRLYIFIGILLITVLSFYVIAFLIAGSTLSLFSGLK